jgi:hypothetical protein
MLRALCFLLLIAATPARADGPCLNPNMDDIAFKIGKNRHKSCPSGVRRLVMGRSFSRQQHFQVRFRDDVRYTTTDPQNQWDWNKLLGFTTNRIHKNSLRLGWRWDPTAQLVRLGFYGYRDSKRTMVDLASVPIGTWADVSITFSDTAMSVTVNGVTHQETGDLGVADWVSVSTWFQRTAYFGGDEKAPHTMHIDIRGLVLDEACRR